MSVRNLRLVVAATTLSLVIAGCSAGSDREVGQAPALSPNSPEVRYESVDEILDNLVAGFGCSLAMDEHALFSRTYFGKTYIEQMRFCRFEQKGTFLVSFFEDAAGFEYMNFESCVAGKAGGYLDISMKDVRGANWSVNNIEVLTEVSDNRLQEVVGGKIVTPFDDC